MHSKWVSLFVVQVFLQVEEGVKEYVSHPTALQIPKGYLTWRKQHMHKHVHACVKFRQQDKKDDGGVRLSNKEK